MKEALLGGFQIQGLYIYQTGTPLRLGNIYYNGNLRDLDVNFDGSTVNNVFGTDLRRSGFYTLPDGSVIKNINFTERTRLQLRGELLDVFNTSLFDNPNLDPRNSGFSSVNATRNLPCELQLGIKFVF